ncbi:MULTISPECIES: IS110 family transposase [Gordonia]|uniref:IS110 family transposase n=1 Tax=Gordonia amicalis TaxID=89053 RepID=A0AAE4UA49_9ACTN|nr:MULTISPECIES: IS110 family transposase [Gordonia]MDV6307883.1 IS110 family transposase [Gordonia amicalis]MDV6311492.1 IS110 family transposase [Gordonia amicalis]MDV7075158.1 IS110 family transposase [Gordonia amicalis]
MTPTMIDTQVVVLGVDTHQRTHHAAIVAADGRPLADREFPTTAAGYTEMWQWACGFGRIEYAAVESSASYGAGLTRMLTDQGVAVIEVNAPDLPRRYAHGKTDQLDAYAAAMAVITGRATAVAKDTRGTVESVRMLTVTRTSAVEEATRIGNQIRDLCTTAPVEFADQARQARTITARAAFIAGLPVPADQDDLSGPAAAFVRAARSLLERHRLAQREVCSLTRELERLLATVVPTLLSRPQIGPVTAARLVITAGDNVERMRTEATFAKLVGAAPLPASSGKTSRHRLNRGGDRQANSALHMIAVGRMKSHAPTRAYVERRSAEHKTKKDIIRCLKRYIAREVFRDLTTDLGTLDKL